MMNPYRYDDSNYSSAKELDARDPLREFREEFLFPKFQGKDAVYFCGNSLGLQPKQTALFVGRELDDWANYGVKGHTEKTEGWLSYHELVTKPLADLVGAKVNEVVAMNSLTTNLHLLMVSFYRPTPSRYKILMEQGAFPSDIYAVRSQLRFHGFDEQALILISPREGEETIRTEDFVTLLETRGTEIALVLLGQVNYLTGQAFATASLVPLIHKAGALVGLDLAHGVGNLELRLHDEQVDFAVWCHYKYINGGPGTIAGAFIHERHTRNGFQGLRFEGWWGHNKETRFQMPAIFQEIGSAEAWQLSNPPILQLAALRASLEIFQRATIARLRLKSKALTNYLAKRLNEVAHLVEIITPSHEDHRGCQLSLRFKSSPEVTMARLTASGVVCDFRKPDIIRVAPTPLYNRFGDVDTFIEVIS